MAMRDHQLVRVDIPGNEPPRVVACQVEGLLVAQMHPRCGDERKDGLAQLLAARRIGDAPARHWHRYLFL
jgi:hypothetical protein